MLLGASSSCQPLLLSVHRLKKKNNLVIHLPSKQHCVSLNSKCISTTRESLKPSFFITFRVSSFVTFSFQRVRKGLLSGTLPETFGQLCHPFFTLSRHGGSSLSSCVTPRSSGTLEHVEERDGPLTSPWVSGRVLSTPGCSSRPSRKSSSRAAGCPVAVCWLWSRVMGEVQLFHACCVLDTTHPHLLPAHRQGDPGAAVLTFGRGHPSCRRTGLAFKPGSNVKARAEFCMMGGLHRDSLLKVSVITRPDFYWEHFHLNQDGVLIAPRLYPVSASRLIKNVAYIDLHVAFCPLYLLSEIQNSEVHRVPVDAFGNAVGFGACPGDAGFFIPRPPSVSARQPHYCLLR